MCGRARCTLQREQVTEAAQVEEFIDGDKYTPVENIGPGQYTPVVFQADASMDSNNSTSGLKQERKKKKTKRLQAMRWGLIPSFTKPTAKPDHFIMFNGRSENLLERPAFKRLVNARRCVILCDGYYEWQQVDKKEKQPYYFYRENSVMKFAGLYDTWINNEGDEMYSCTILTTAITPELKWLHTRIPVILTDEGVTRWLSDAKFGELKDLLVAYRGMDLKYHPVDKRVGSIRFQSENCSKKVDIKHAGDIKSFFGVKTEKSNVHDHKENEQKSPNNQPPEEAIPNERIKEEDTKFAANETKSSICEPKMDVHATPEKQSTPTKARKLQQQLQWDSPTKSPLKTDFTMASALTTGTKRSASTTLSSSSSSQQKLSKKPKTPVASSPKQGTLDAFFHPKDPK